MIVLVIEDSSPMRAMICHALHRLAHAVVIDARDGKDGLDKLTEIQPDIVITDINMPVMDGFTFIERLRQLPGHARTPVIVLTTEGAIEDRERAAALGVRAYITKPVRQQDVVDAIMAVTGGVAPATEPERSLDKIVLRIDYEDGKDLLEDYAANLSRGEIIVANHRTLPAGTQLRVALMFPTLAEPFQLDGVVRSSSASPLPTLCVELVNGAEREQLAHLIDRIRSAGVR